MATGKKNNRLLQAINAGVGHAAIALSQMLGKKIQIAVSAIDIAPTEEFLTTIHGKNDPYVVAPYIRTLGDIQGVMMVMFDRNSAIRLCDLLLSKKPDELEFIDESCQSALKEMGSILTSAFFTTIADTTGLSVFLHIPYFAFDNVRVLTKAIARQVLGAGTNSHCIGAEFVESGTRVTGSFIFIPLKETMKVLTEKLSN